MLTRKEFFKLKVVIVMGYNGLEFHGMQKNAGVQTIEQAVEKALYDSELILDHNFDSLQKIKWSRAARTDKGVHAIANFVNCKLSITSKYLEGGEELENAEGEAPADNQEVAKGKDKNRIDWKKIIGTINSNLPSSVRVHCIKRITKAFDVKQSARSRLYEYLSPTSMFLKDATVTAEAEDKTLERLQVLCAKFKGTHNFHNYTTKMRASDPKAMRYIMDFQCELIDHKEKGRFYLFKIRGQSFIYHQIRKMIGIMVQVIHQDYKDGFIDNSFYQNSIAIWLAPPQGLFLDRVTFEAYNKKLDIPEKLEFNPEEEAQLQDFKENTIYPLIVEAEYKNKTFSTWLETTKVAEAQGRVQAMESADEEGEDDDGEQKGGKGKGKKGKYQKDQKNKPAENKPEEPKPEEAKPEENKTEAKEDGTQ